MHSGWWRSTFLRVFNFVQVKRLGTNFWGEPNMQKVWIIWSPLLPKFIVFLYISKYSAWLKSTFPRLLKFPQIKEGGPNFFGEPILLKVWIIWYPLLCFIFKSFVDQNSSSLSRSQFILHDWEVFFPEPFNFYKLKRGDLISGVNQFCTKSALFGFPFCIYILSVLYIQMHCLSLDFNAFSMIQEYFSQSLEISTN